MASFVSIVVQWVVVSGVMVALLIYALTIPGAAEGPELKRSAWAGFWAGLVVSVIYIISQLGQIREPSFESLTLPGLQIGPIAVGLVIGFIFLWLVRILIPTRIVGLVTLLLSATSSSALFAYIFVDAVRVSVLYASLGAALGILLHIVLFPGSVRGTLRQTS